MKRCCKDDPLAEVVGSIPILLFGSEEMGEHSHQIRPLNSFVLTGVVNHSSWCSSPDWASNFNALAFYSENINLHSRQENFKNILTLCKTLMLGVFWKKYQFPFSTRKFQRYFNFLQRDWFQFYFFFFSDSSLSFLFLILSSTSAAFLACSSSSSFLYCSLLSFPSCL